jgi:hypothetical protein
MHTACVCAVCACNCGGGKSCPGRLAIHIAWAQLSSWACVKNYIADQAYPLFQGLSTCWDVAATAYAMVLPGV